MRGSDATSGPLFSNVDLEDQVPAKHPLRTIREIVNEVLASLDGEFAKLYETTGRESVAPERLLRASLLQAFYSIRSERQLMEQLDYNLLFGWFAGLGVDDPVWDHSLLVRRAIRDRRAIDACSQALGWSYLPLCLGFSHSDSRHMPPSSRLSQ